MQKLNTKLLILFKLVHGLHALDSEISCRKLSFIRKLFSSRNSVIKRLAKLNLL